VVSSTRISSAWRRHSATKAYSCSMAGEPSILPFF
jgi:hypothetical protein